MSLPHYPRFMKLNCSAIPVSALAVPVKTATFAFAMLSLAAAAAPAPLFGPTFYGDAPDDHHPWAIHDGNRPQPTIITPGTFSSQEEPGKPPSDAVILFDGTDLSKWEADVDNEGVATKWVIKNGAMECVPGSGYIRTRDKFGDFQLHVEWASPTHVQGDSQGRGNSGVFLMGLVEIQVLDNFNNPTYSDGMAGAVYGQMPPLVNALRSPGQWEVYDIVFRRPLYRDGELIRPGHVTVFENGVLVQDHTPIEGPTGHMARTKAEHFPDAGPLKLQDHGNPVRYRNIWYRPLPHDSLEGGTDGYLTTEATTAKRKEIAASIRQDAEQMEAGSVHQMLRLGESLQYDRDEAVQTKVQNMAAHYVSALEQTAASEIESKRNQARHVRDCFAYLIKFHVLTSDFEPQAKLKQIIKEHNWDKHKPGEGH